ncbi:MAG TPA: response regulator [Rudaea sp.]
MTAAAALRVLLIDDEAPMLRAQAALLREHAVFATEDPAGAQALAQEHDVDVILCDYRMADTNGIELLRTLRLSHPRALRILTASRPDARTVFDAINEGEVFRLVTKPWDNTGLRSAVSEAGRTARDAPQITFAALRGPEYDHARTQVAILVIGGETEAQQRLREILQPYYKLHFASSMERAVQIMEQHETGVIISDTQTGRSDLVAPIKALRQTHPQIGVAMLAGRIDADMAIGLVNEGQVLRVLPRPLQMGTVRLAVDTALGNYWRYKRQPQAARRVLPALPAPNSPHAPTRLPPALLNRIHSLPGRLLGAGD